MVYKIPHQSAVKLPSMYRTVFLATLLALIPLLAACPGEVIPPCTGDDCPQPCANVEDAEFTSTRGTFESSGATFKNCYVQGQSTTAFFRLTPTEKADLSAERAVIVFAIVEDDRDKPENEREWNDVTGVIIDVNRFSVSPDIFSNPLPMSQVATGVSADVSFKISDKATRGNFGLVISTFRLGQNQEPDDVTSDDTAVVGRATYWFSVE
jgi:hypothetical protein